MRCAIVKVYKDHGISGAKRRDKRRAFDALCRDATQRRFHLVMAWSVDRLGRSLQDLIGFLSELHALIENRNTTGLAAMDLLAALASEKDAAAKAAKNTGL